MGERQWKGRIGVISFGVFLILVAVTWLNYPTLPSEIRLLSEDLRIYYRPVGLYLGLLGAFGFFGVSFGVWLLIIAAARAVFRQGLCRILADASGGVFFAGCGYVSMKYAQGAIPRDIVLPLFIVVIGVIVVINGVVRFSR